MYLASGSFDKTIRVWNIAQSEPESLLVLGEHQLNVSDVSWSADSSRLLSGSFDQTVKEWDMVTGGLLQSHEAPGFVQAVCYDPIDEHVFYAGTTHKTIMVGDRRAPGTPAAAMQNESMINTVYVDPDGSALLSGDSSGMVKCWDLRTRRCIHEHNNSEDGSKPISHIHATRARPQFDRGNQAHDDDASGGRYLAVNSYDNVLRVHDRRTMMLNQPRQPSPAPFAGPDAADEHEPAVEIKVLQPAAEAKARRMNLFLNRPGPASLLCAVKGHKNRNWPIRSSFFHGVSHRGHTKTRTKNLKQTDESELEDDGAEDDDAEGDSGREISVHESLFLATGSADSKIYLYDIAGNESGSSELVQQLQGHTDRVYAVNFHPTEPILVRPPAR
jgi:COMPASS component SWD3